MNLIPAAPNTRIVEYPSAETVAVVVGFIHVQGTRVDPVTALARGSAIYAHEAIQFADNSLDYPAKGLHFPSYADWEEYMSANAPKKEVPVDSPAVDTSPLKFGEKTYNTKSFWHWDLANAIFEIEGGQPYPNDPRAVKIKREEFAALKRDGAVKVDPHVGLIIEDDPAPAPTAAAPEPEADEDDLDDVI